MPLLHNISKLEVPYHTKEGPVCLTDLSVELRNLGRALSPTRFTAGLHLLDHTKGPRYLLLSSNHHALSQSGINQPFRVPPLFLLSPDDIQQAIADHSSGEGIVVPLWHDPTKESLTILLSTTSGRNCPLFLITLLHHTRLRLKTDGSSAMVYSYGGRADRVRLSQSIHNLQEERLCFAPPIAQHRPTGIPRTAHQITARGFPLHHLSLVPKSFFYQQVCRALGKKDLKGGDCFFIITGSQGIRDNCIDGGLWVSATAPSKTSGHVSFEVEYQVDSFIIRMATASGGQNARKLLLSLMEDTNWKCLHDGAPFPYPIDRTANVLTDDQRLRSLWNSKRTLLPLKDSTPRRIDENSVLLIDNNRPLDELILYDESWLDRAILLLLEDDFETAPFWFLIGSNGARQRDDHLRGPLSLIRVPLPDKSHDIPIPMIVTKTPAGLQKVLHTQRVSGKGRLGILDLLLSRARLGLSWNGAALPESSRGDRRIYCQNHVRWAHCITADPDVPKPNYDAGKPTITILTGHYFPQHLGRLVPRKSWEHIVQQLHDTKRPGHGAKIHFALAISEKARMISKRGIRFSTDPIQCAKSVRGMLQYHQATDRWVLVAESLLGNHRFIGAEMLLFHTDWGLGCDGTFATNPRHFLDNYGYDLSLDLHNRTKEIRVFL